MASPIFNRPDFNELLQRCAAICREAFDDEKVDAKPYALHKQEAFPYFTCRIGRTPIGDDGEELDEYEISVIVRHVVGHSTEGFDGEAEARLYAQMTAVIQTFNRRQLLQSEAFEDGMDDLEEARCVETRGFTVFENTGLGVSQVGTEYTIRCTFRFENEQDYL